MTDQVEHGDASPVRLENACNLFNAVLIRCDQIRIHFAQRECLRAQFPDQRSSVLNCGVYEDDFHPLGIWKCLFHGMAGHLIYTTKQRSKIKISAKNCPPAEIKNLYAVFLTQTPHIIHSPTTPDGYNRQSEASQPSQPYGPFNYSYLNKTGIHLFCESLANERKDANQIRINV